jgi:hypothetical protein
MRVHHLVVYGILLIVACGSPTGPGSPSADLRQAFSHGTCEGTGVVRYAALPMRLADIGSFVPMGAVTGNHVTPIDHQYLYPREFSGPRDRYELFAPFTGHIVQIQQREVGPGAQEYRVIFEGSCTFWVYYDLVNVLEPAVAATAGSDLTNRGTAYVRIPVTAGERIGWFGQHGMDLGTVNAEVTLAGFVVPEHYRAEPWKIHSVDGLDYFDEPLRSQLNALNRRQALPRGGKIDYDIDGRAVGNWFLVGTNGYAGATGTTGSNNYWVGHLSLIYGHIDPTMVVISMGMPDGSSRQWGVRGNGPNPGVVGAGVGPLEYEVVELRGDSIRHSAASPLQGTLLIQVLPERQMRVEYFPGLDRTLVSAFTPAAKLYER